MISRVLSSIDGISAYPLISMVIFIVFFVVVTLWVIRLDEKYLIKMSKLPLDQKSEDQEERNS